MKNENNKPTPSTANGKRSDEAACSAFTDAMRLAEMPPQKTGDWMDAAGQMCKHCRDGEDVDQAAMRIIAAEYRKAESALESIEEIYVDGCDTHKDFQAMGEIARAYFKS